MRWSVIFGVLGFVGCGSSGIEVPVDVDRSLSSLTTEETVEICEAVGGYARERLTARQRCAESQIVLAQTQTMDGRTECERFESCLQDPPPPNPYECTLLCMVREPGCTATVEAYLACRQAGFDRRDEQLDRYACDAPVPAPTEGDPPACTALWDRCFDPSSPHASVVSVECAGNVIVVD